MEGESWNLLGRSVCQGNSEGEGLRTTLIRRVGEGVCGYGCREVRMECAEVEYAEYRVLREDWSEGSHGVADYEG